MKNKTRLISLLSLLLIFILAACNDSNDANLSFAANLTSLQPPVVSAESYNGVIRLSWTPDANAKGYSVLRKASGEADVVLLDGSQLVYECSDWAKNEYSFQDGKTYSYYVTALSGVSNEGLSLNSETAYTYIQNSPPAKIDVKAKNSGQGSAMDRIEAKASSLLYNGKCYTVVSFRPLQYNESLFVEYLLGDVEHFSAEPATPVTMTLGAGISQIRLPEIAGKNYIRLTNKFAGSDSDYYESVTSEVQVNGNESNYFETVSELKAEKKDNAVLLSWTGAEEASSYSIYRIESDGVRTRESEWFEVCSYSDGLLKNSDGLWYFIDTDASPELSYVYVVLAYRGEDCSNLSASVVYSAVLPGIENFVISSIGDDGIVLLWDDDGLSEYALSYAKINAYNCNNAWSTLNYSACPVNLTNLSAGSYFYRFKESIINYALVFRLTNSFGDVKYLQARKSDSDYYDYALLKNLTASSEVAETDVIVMLQLIGQSVTRGLYSVYKRATDINGLPETNWILTKEKKEPRADGIIPLNENRDSASGKTRYYQYRVCQNVDYADRSFEINFMIAKATEAEDAALATIVIPKAD